MISDSSASCEKDSNNLNGKDEEYEETVEALKVLFQGKNPPAASNVQNLLKASLDKRREWLTTSIVSVHCIVERYPLFKQSKWVCIWHMHTII